MDRRRFLKTAAGLFVPAAPAILLPGLVRAQGGMGPGPGMAHATGGGALGLQTNLSAFFELDNSLADSTGTVTNLTNNNTVTFTTDTPGATGQQCGVFASASSQYLSHADVTALQIAGVDFSVMAWAKFVSFNDMVVVCKDLTAFPQNGYQLGTGFSSGQKGRAQVRSGGSSQAAIGNTFGTLATNTWYLLVHTYSATTKISSLSVQNSAFDASGALGSNPSGDTGQFNIGAAAGVSPATFMNGRICRVGLWKNRILSSGDVAALYNSGAGLTYAGMA